MLPHLVVLFCAVAGAGLYSADEPYVRLPPPVRDSADEYQEPGLPPPARDSADEYQEPGLPPPARDSADEYYLTLREAILIALAGNPELEALSYEREISRNNIDPARAGKMPRIDLNATAYVGYADGRTQTAGLPGGPGGNGESAPIELDGITHGVSVAPEVNWVVFDGGRGNAILDQLRLVDATMALNVAAARERTVATVSQAYLTAARLGSQLELDRRNIALTQDRLERVRRDARYGTGNSLRRLQTEVQLNTDSTAYRTTRTRLENAKRDLNLLLGRNPEVPVVLDTTLHPRPRPLTFDSLYALLVANNENLDLARRRLDLARNELDRAERSTAPRLQLYAGPRYLNATDNSSFLQENRNFGPEAGIRISKILWDGGVRRIDEQNARLRIEQRDRERQATELELRTRLRQAVADYDLNRSQLAAEEQNLPTFELNYEKARTDFRLGQVDATAVRTAQTDLNAARTRLTLRRYGLMSSEVEVRRLTGTLIR
jgi:outer membrane protein TolC